MLPEVLKGERAGGLLTGQGIGSVDLGDQGDARPAARKNPEKDQGLDDTQPPGEAGWNSRDKAS